MPKRFFFRKSYGFRDKGFLCCHLVTLEPLDGFNKILTGFNTRQRQRIFPLNSASRPALGPTQPPIKWVPVVLSPGVKRCRGVMLTTHPHLVPRLSMSRNYTSSPPMRLHGV
jgi:hypothetical protein